MSKKANMVATEAAEVGMQADLTASAALANDMAAALKGTYPRARISMLEPPEQVARGVFALIDKRLGNQSAETWLDRQELGIKVLAECLATWQAESLDAKIAAWLSSEGRRLVEFDGGGKIGCILTDGDCDRHCGEGETPGEALGKALIAFDEERDDD